MKFRKSTALILSGVLLLLGAAGFAVYNNADSDRAGKSAASIAAVIAEGLPTKPAAETTPQNINHDVFVPEMETKEIDGALYIGILEIPALELTLPVRENWSYDALKLSPCRYSGSYYTNDLVICAHNYASHFNGLRTIAMGEDVYFTAVGGRTYHYVITNRETLNPDEAERMSTPDGWDLTLFTCYIGGATRCTIRCSLAEN